MLERPKPESRSFYDYNECVRYLEEKHNCDFRDYSKKEDFFNRIKLETDAQFGENGWWDVVPSEYTTEQRRASEYYEKLALDAPPYLDFWHFVLERFDLSNGSFFTMYTDELMEEAADWQKEIIGFFREEFGDEISFIVQW